MPSFLQVLASPRKASRQSRPMSLRVPPLTWRLVTWQRMSFSEPFAVQRDFRVIEHHQQFVFVGVQPLQQAAKGDEACAPLKRCDRSAPASLRRRCVGASR